MEEHRWPPWGMPCHSVCYWELQSDLTWNSEILNWAWIFSRIHLVDKEGLYIVKMQICGQALNALPRPRWIRPWKNNEHYRNVLELVDGNRSYFTEAIKKYLQKKWKKEPSQKLHHIAAVVKEKMTSWRKCSQIQFVFPSSH